MKDLDRDLRKQHEEWLREFYKAAHNSPKRSLTYATIGQRRRRRLTRRGLRILIETWQDKAPATRQVRGVHMVTARQSMGYETQQRAVGSI